MAGADTNAKEVTEEIVPDQALARIAAGCSQNRDQLEIILSPYQHTLCHSFSLAGLGLHTGSPARVTVYPAEPNQGRYFLRTDTEHPVPVIANLSRVDRTQLCTTLRQANHAIATVEHLLAALVGMGIDNARIELQGSEVPILDGSAQKWVEAILTAGRQAQSQSRQVVSLRQPVIERSDDAFVMAIPHPYSYPLFSYGIDFPCAAIGRQWCSFDLSRFVEDVAPARTFGQAKDVETLRAKGLIKGGNLENALLCDVNGWLNPPLRFANEPVRHKLLDLIGDLSLLGVLPLAHYVAYKASHSLHIRFAQRLQQEMTGLLTSSF